MAKRSSSSSSKFITLLLLAGFGALAWFLAPMFLPMYRWIEIDFIKVAQAASSNGMPLTTEQVSTKYKIEFAYKPRSDSDPRPFVVMKMDPPYYSIVPDDDWSFDEDGLLLRAKVIGDRTGQKPSGFMFGSGQWKDQYFRTEAWRLPKGTKGLDSERPIFMYDSMTLEKFSIGEAEVRHNEIATTNKWIKDDDGIEEAK